MGFKLWTTNEVLTSPDLNNYLMKQAVVVCTSGTRPASPPTGMLIFETDTKLYKNYNGSAWGTVGLNLSDYQVQQQDNTVQSSISSTTYVAGSPVVGFAFTAPPSGQIEVMVGGYLIMQTNTGEVRLGWEIRTGNVVGSGSVVWAPTYYRGVVAGSAVNTSAPARASGSHSMVVGSLTPFAAYNIRAMYAVNAGAVSGQIDFRNLIVKPWIV